MASITAIDQFMQSPRPTILIVEDNKANILIISLLLEQLQYIYDIACNGQEAFQKIKDNHDNYVAILMDIYMPELDGIATTQLVREEERLYNLPHIPIIGISAYALEEDQEQYLAVGMDDYITKPFKAEEIQEKLSAVMHPEEYYSHVA